MRPLWLVVAIACGLLAVANVASASVREEARSLASTLAAVTAAPGDASPSPESIPYPLSSRVDEVTPAPTATDSPRNHGEAVSEVARNKLAVGEKMITLGNGEVKYIRNHGMAVREAAHDKAGASTKSGSPGKGKGQAKAKGKIRNGD
jgi:hypothetical protein